MALRIWMQAIRANSLQRGILGYMTNETQRDICDHGIEGITRILSEHEPNTKHSAHADRSAAVALILRHDDQGALEILFIQRAEHPDDPWSGQMALPGGRLDPEDATLEAAARRETREEVGLELHPDMAIGRLHDLIGGPKTKVQLSVSPFVYHHPDPPALTHNIEVADTVWVPLRFLGNPDNVSPYTFHLDPEQREFPSFQYETYTIWGLTYRIIKDYVALFGVELPCDPIISDVE